MVRVKRRFEKVLEELAFEAGYKRRVKFESILSGENSPVLELRHTYYPKSLEEAENIVSFLKSSDVYSKSEGLIHVNVDENSNVVTMVYSWNKDDAESVLNFEDNLIKSIKADVDGCSITDLAIITAGVVDEASVKNEWGKNEDGSVFYRKYI